MEKQARRLAAALSVALALAVGGGLLPGTAAAEAEAVRLDTHTRSYAPGETPERWDVDKFAPFFGSGEKMFLQFVHESDEEHYIHLAAGSNNSFYVGVEEEFRLQDWPILEWEWKATKLPQGGDVRKAESDDQAGLMCVVVDPGLIGAKALCYLYENEGPKDTPIISRKRDDSRYIILRTGAEDGTGTWYHERRNAYEDYKRAFGEEPDDTAALGMMIDADETETTSEAFYRNIYRRRAAGTGG